MNKAFNSIGIAGLLTTLAATANADEKVIECISDPIDYTSVGTITYCATTNNGTVDMVIRSSREIPLDCWTGTHQAGQPRQGIVDYEKVIVGFDKDGKPIEEKNDIIGECKVEWNLAQGVFDRARREGNTSLFPSVEDFVAHYLADVRRSLYAKR